MAGTATAAKPPLTEKKRAAIEAELRLTAEALLALHVKNARLFAQMDGLESELKAKATTLGDSFKEEFLGRGVVSVSPRKDKEMRGMVWELVPLAWAAVPPAEQKPWIARGVVKSVEDWSSANYGRVTVKLFAAAA